MKAAYFYPIFYQIMIELLAMRFWYITICLLFLCGSIFSQTPDGWRGLVIDESTPEQAITALGQPKSDKNGDNPFPGSARFIKYYFVEKKSVKKLRILHWENIEGFDDVKLAFDDKSKLVVINLEPKKIKAPEFFASFTSLDFKQFKDSSIYLVYTERSLYLCQLQATFGQAFGAAMAGASVGGGVYGQSVAKKTLGDLASANGKLTFLEIISKTVLKSQKAQNGSELLK